MEDRQDITVPMPAEMVEEIESRLTYGDSRAGWIREACEMRLEAESTGDQGNASSRLGSSSVGGLLSVN